MKKINLLLFIILFYSVDLIYAQDLHYTNYRNISNFFNPAQTGDYAGTYKLQAVARSQYAKTYQQSNIGGQINFSSPVSFFHWFSLGINALYDEAGSLKLSAKGAGLSLAYHIANSKNTSAIAIGVSAQNLTLGANTRLYRSENNILGIPDPDEKLLKDFNANLMTFGLGIHYRNQFSKKSSFYTGFAYNHLNQPGFTFHNGKNLSQYGKRLNFNFNFRTQISSSILLEPASYISISENQKNINVQLMSEWQILQSAKWKGVLGLSNRVGESTAFILGYASRKLNVTASFDMLYNNLKNPLNRSGAIELGAYYIIFPKVRPEVKREAVCPRL